MARVLGGVVFYGEVVVLVLSWWPLLVVIMVFTQFCLILFFLKNFKSSFQSNIF